MAPPPAAMRASVLVRWHELRRAVTAFSALIGMVIAVVLAWPALGAVSAVTIMVAVDAHLAIRSGRRLVAPTLIVDVTIAGFACIIAGVPPAGIASVTAYFIVLVAVLSQSVRSWPLGLYTILVGVFASVAPIVFSFEDPPLERTIAAGVAAIVVFGIATLDLIRRFVLSVREREEIEARQLTVSNAVSVASQALVAEDDARALAFALEAIRGAIDAPIAFVEQNVEDSEWGLSAVVVESVAALGDVHPVYRRGSRTPWSSVQGCRTHLEGGAPFFFRVEEVSGTARDRSGDGGARTEVNVPILVNGAWVGVIGAADPDPNRTWESDELALLRTLADLTAAFWQRVEDMRVRDSLIGSLDGRLRYEEALAKSSTALLGERGVGVEAALESIGVAARVDEVYITGTAAEADGSPSARVIANWVQPGLVPIHPVDEIVSYRDMPAILDAIHQGSLARTMDGTNAEIVVGIEVGGGWFGSVGFLRRKASRSWSKRDAAFLRTIADILGAYYERMENRRRLESLLTSKDQLIASVSHELRTPLTAVVGLAEELKENSSTIHGEEKAQLIDVIAKESRDMADLVEDLLIAARSEDGTVPVFPERTDLSLLAASVASSLTVPETVSLVVEDSPSAAYADPVRVRQVIRNLLTNAMRYGGTNVTVSFGVDDGVAFLNVHDDGHGIPDRDLEVVFEPYGRSTAGRTAVGSVGLGLTLSKRLSELMGGSLSYIPGDGCTFRLTVPSAPEAAVASEAS